MHATSFRLLRFVLYVLLLGRLVTLGEGRIGGRKIITRDGGNFPWGSLRLPQTLFPLNYKITLDTNLKLFNVKGEVGITVKCEKPTANIILHLRDMNVTKTAVFEKKQQDVKFFDDLRDVYEDEELIESDAKKEQDRELHVLKTMKNKTLEMFLIKVKEELIWGQTYKIYIQFNYPLTDKLLGFYRSSYTAKDGEKRYLAATLFEPTDARSAFPCFDEPAMKATFTVTIIRDGQYRALSNMPIDSTVKIGEDLYADHFKESVKMSTYLVAFLVSDFKSIETNTSSGIKVRLWAPPLQISQGAYALDIAAKTLANYEKFFKIPFPLPKQDLVAIPDFGTGAEENWGLIGYSAAMVLLDPNKTSDSIKQDVCETVTHELAHQWFGNLVTMKWWNDLWLNEGFATYMEDIGSSFVEPNWSMLDQFILEKLYEAFSDDQSRFSHPISVEVEDPKEIDNIFDSISYEKGASVIRMLRDFLGSEGFTSGLQLYLKKFAYGNAVSDDLWACMTQQTGINVKKVMDSWILQMGLPVVTITRMDQEKARADQKLFLIAPGAKPNQSSPFNYTWNIPLTYITQKKKTITQVWMNRGPASLNWASSDGWIKANVDQIGYYRVNYETENWKSLYHQLLSDHKFVACEDGRLSWRRSSEVLYPSEADGQNVLDDPNYTHSDELNRARRGTFHELNSALSAADRSGLIDDAFHLARSNLLKQTIALDLTEYIINEIDYVPLKTFVTNMYYIGDNLLLRKSIGLFKSYMLKQLDPTIKRLGWDDEGSHLDKLLRPYIFLVACDCSGKEVISRFKKMFQLAMEGHFIKSNLRAVVYSIGVREGGVKEWNQVYAKYKSTNIASEKKILLSALTYTLVPEMIERCLNYSLDKDKIRPQDTLVVISDLASDPRTWRMAWDFVRNNWKILYRKYSRGSDLWSYLITKLMVKCNTLAQLKEFMEFFKDYPSTASAYRQVQMGMEQIRANIMWLSEHEDEVTAWLKRHV